MGLYGGRANLEIIAAAEESPGVEAEGPREPAAGACVVWEPLVSLLSAAVSCPGNETRPQSCK